MSYHDETFAERICRLLGPGLKNPEQTREILAKLSDVQKHTPQPSNESVCERTSEEPCQLHQPQLFTLTNYPYENQRAAKERVR